MNEDSYLASPPIFLVADGMGGYRFGDQASNAVVRSFEHAIVPDAVTSSDTVMAAIDTAHSEIARIAEAEPAGTTVSGLALVSSPSDQKAAWLVFNIGDSRVYQWSANSLAQISTDHSVVQELIDSGALSVADAEGHPERNVVTRAVGAGSSADVDVWLIPIDSSQRFLICSDGLTKEISDDELSVTLGQNDEVADAAEALMHKALDSGARDNVTVVVVDSSFEPEGVTLESHQSLAEHLESTLPRGGRS